jgi:hypothetical protein
MRAGSGVALVVWCVLLMAVFAWPALRATAGAVPGDAGDDLTRGTVRVALGFYAVAAVVMLLLRRGEWEATSARGQLARCCWTLAWGAYLVHLAMAFHHYHGWSHVRAIEHVREASGVGEGIYGSHLFTLLWTLDVAWWWQNSASYAARPGWIDRVLHGFMIFMVFNATVVYETGFIRWAGLFLTEALARLWVLRPACRQVPPVPTTGERPTPTEWTITPAGK